MKTDSSNCMVVFVMWLHYFEHLDMGIKFVKNAFTVVVALIYVSFFILYKYHSKNYIHFLYLAVYCRKTLSFLFG